jgi:hypothetical protein
VVVVLLLLVMVQVAPGAAVWQHRCVVGFALVLLDWEEG